MEGSLKQREYDNTGWAKHQLMVLAQLEGHTLLLKDLIKEISEMKQDVAISANDYKNWRENTSAKIDSIQKNLDFIWDDDRGLDARLIYLEDNIKIDKQSSIKFWGSWALIGGAFVIVLEFFLKTLEFFIHKP
jgi:hypothetical protein